MTSPIGIIYIPCWRTDFDPYALDLYRKCSHHCKYCYVKWEQQAKLPAYKPDFIGEQLRDLAIRPDAPVRVHLSHFSDPYDVDDTTETRQILELFNRYHNPFSILSKAGTKAVRDFDLYFDGCRFGQSLTLDNDADSKHWEPGAALPADRIDALRQAHNRGIETWAVLEPVIVPEQSINLIKQTAEFVGFYWLGKINHHPELEAGISWAEYLSQAKAILVAQNKNFGIKWQLDRAARLEMR